MLGKLTRTEFLTSGFPALPIKKITNKNISFMKLIVDSFTVNVLEYIHISLQLFKSNLMTLKTSLKFGITRAYNITYLKKLLGSLGKVLCKLEGSIKPANTGTTLH